MLLQQAGTHIGAIEAHPPSQIEGESKREGEGLTSTDPRVPAASELVSPHRFGMLYTEMLFSISGVQCAQLEKKRYAFFSPYISNLLYSCPGEYNECGEFKVSEENEGGVLSLAPSTCGLSGHLEGVAVMVAGE